MTQQAQAEALLPCPFCGSDAEHVHMAAGEEIVRCTNAVSCFQPWTAQPTYTYAQKEWNRRAPAQQAVPWVQAMDEALVCAHIDVASPGDDLVTAKSKLNRLICHEIEVARHFEKERRETEGWKLMPVDPSLNMLKEAFGICGPNGQPIPELIERAKAKYGALLAATPPHQLPR